MSSNAGQRQRSGLSCLLNQRIVKCTRQHICMTAEWIRKGDSVHSSHRRQRDNQNQKVLQPFSTKGNIT